MAGDDSASARLAEMVYDDLKAIAEQSFRNERNGHTLQPTAVVHEALARLLGHEPIDWAGRTHFMAVAAQTMRRVLIDHARKRDAAKRGGPNGKRITLDGDYAIDGHADLDLVVLQEALEKLQRRSERQARIVELRFFAGLTECDAASVLGVSERTVRGDWLHARAWLRRELAGDEA